MEVIGSMESLTVIALRFIPAFIFAEFDGGVPLKSPSTG